MRKSCQIAKDALEYAGSLVKPGVTTDFIDKMVHDFIVINIFYKSCNIMPTHHLWDIKVFQNQFAHQVNTFVLLIK